MARHCRQREILAERQKRPEEGNNKFAPLLSKVCRRIEGGIAARPYEGKAQSTRCWRCGEAGHVLWDCPNRAAWPRRAEVQHKRKCGKCGGNNHREQKCPSVKL